LRIDCLSGAAADLEDIKRHYLEAGGKALALRVVRRIRAAVASLADIPSNSILYIFRRFGNLVPRKIAVL